MTRRPAKQSRSAGTPSRKVVIIASLVVLIIVGVFVYLYYVDANTSPAVVQDWRFYLAIDDALTNQNITIPAGIGVAGGIWMNHTWDAYGPPGGQYAPLSTRDTSGTIYVQFIALKPGLAPFYLSDFFSIWGQVYNSTCVGYGSGMYCSTNYPPVISNGSSEYCLSNIVPPIDNGKTWEIIINSHLPCSSYP